MRFGPPIVRHHGPAVDADAIDTVTGRTGALGVEDLQCAHTSRSRATASSADRRIEP